MGNTLSYIKLTEEEIKAFSKGNHIFRDSKAYIPTLKVVSDCKDIINKGMLGFIEVLYYIDKREVAIRQSIQYPEDATTYKFITESNESFEIVTKEYVTTLDDYTIKIGETLVVYTERVSQVF